MVVNGSQWTTLDGGSSNDLLNITFSNGVFTIVGDKGTILYSSSGSGWTQLPVMNGVRLYSIVKY